MAYVSTQMTNAPFGARVADAFADMAVTYAKWRLFRQTLKELYQLDSTELADLGLNGQSLRTIAHDAVYGAK